MRIAIDALTTRGRSGVRSYLRRMAERFPELYPDDHFVFFVTPEVREDIDDSRPNVELVVSKFAGKSAVARLLWEQFVLPRELKRRSVDIVYIFSVFDILLAPCPTVIRIGNMLPYTDEAVEAVRGARARARLFVLRWATRFSVRTSTATLVMSDVAADLLQKIGGFPAGKVRGINRGVDLEEISTEQVEPGRLPDDYILVSSHLQDYKKLVEIVDAYAMLPNDGSRPKLLFIGDDKSEWMGDALRASITRQELEDDVVFLGYVERGQLRDVLARSRVTVFPSLVETCPVTLLEELLVGCALVVSDRSVMPGLCGDAVMYYDPNSAEELAKCLTRMLESDETRLRWGEAARARSREIGIDWETALRRRRDFFGELIGAAVPSVSDA